MGKGDARRPGDEKVYRRNFDLIFGARKKKHLTEAPSAASVPAVQQAVNNSQAAGHDAQHLD